METKNWTLNHIPFYSELEGSKVILIAGCGGGYDVYSGIPLFFNLRQMGYTCILWNLSFTSEDTLRDARSSEIVKNTLWKVTGKEKVDEGTYFPEYYLAQYLEQAGITDNNFVYTAAKVGCKTLKPALQQIIDEHQIDTVIMIDGGTDSLMQGDEEGLGTPHEDMLSIKITHDCTVNKKFLLCLGFGIDAFHGVCHVHFLQNTAQIIEEGGYLGVFTLMREMSECQHFIKAVQYSASKMEPSIVQSSILNAVLGKFGDFHFTDRTKGSRLFINPLMGLYWCYDLTAVARNVKYLDLLGDTTSITQIDTILKNYRKDLGYKNYRTTEPFPH